MNRETAFNNYINRNDGVNLNSANIQRVYNNLVLADSQHKLVAFLLNKNPYKSRFYLKTPAQVRNCDQCALICALNIYGSQNPGFAKRINQAFFEASKTSAKELQNLNLILYWQMNLQADEAGLINFADFSLINHINGKMKKIKLKNIIKWILLACAGSMGAPGFAMIGLLPLTALSAVLMLYSLYQLLIWCVSPVVKPENIHKYAREVSDTAYKADYNKQV